MSVHFSNVTTWNDTYVVVLRKHFDLQQMAYIYRDKYCPAK